MRNVEENKIMVLKKLSVSNFKMLEHLDLVFEQGMIGVNKWSGVG